MQFISLRDLESSQRKQRDAPVQLILDLFVALFLLFHFIILLFSFVPDANFTVLQFLLLSCMAFMENTIAGGKIYLRIISSGFLHFQVECTFQYHHKKLYISFNIYIAYYSIYNAYYIFVLNSQIKTLRVSNEKRKKQKRLILKIDKEINKNAVCTFKVMLMCRM